MKLKTHQTASYILALKLMQEQNPDVTKAKELLLDALAKDSDPYAAYALGTWYFYGVNTMCLNKQKAIELWIMAANAKVLDALYDLAVAYETGDGIKKNLRKSFLLYTDAALRGQAKAIFEVGRCYFYGIGVPANKKIALIWFDKAEEMGVYESRGNS
jgi:TPR repeat protein